MLLPGQAGWWDVVRGPVMVRFPCLLAEFTHDVAVFYLIERSAHVDLFLLHLLFGGMVITSQSLLAGSRRKFMIPSRL